MRVSDVKRLMRSETTRREKIIALREKMTVVNAQLNRVVLAKKPHFQNVIKLDEAGGKYLAADAIKMSRDYHRSMDEMEKYLVKETSDPTLGNLWKLLGIAASLLAFSMNEEEKMDQLITQLENDLGDDIAALSADQDALDDMKVSQSQLEKDAESWFGSFKDMVTGERSKIAKTIEDLEKEIDGLTAKIAREQSDLKIAKMRRLVLDIEI
ncbi:MAG: hypothetical protein WD046_10160 [Paracoccaceae bacterium]